MSILQYRELFEYEIDCNQKMVLMLETVPQDRRTDPLFQRAVSIADHLIACRNNWLIWMIKSDAQLAPWYDNKAKIEDLSAQFEEMHIAWSNYLGALTDEGLAEEMEIVDGVLFRWYIEGQVIQLAEHAHYHRGQVTLIVDMLGGKVMDTDYADFGMSKNPRYGVI